MASPDPLPLDELDRIPDPARGVADRPIPPPIVPAEPSPTRADRRRRGLVGLAVAAAWIAAALLRFGVRGDIGAAGVSGPLAAWAIAVGAGLAFLLRPRARGLPAGVRGVQHALWVVPAIYVVGILLVDGSSAGVEIPLGWETARACLGVAVLMALGPLALMATLLRGSFASAPALRGAAVGALAGFAGTIGIHAHCPARSFGHLLVAHGPAIVLGAIAGGLFGRLGGRP
jgi:hypothetical protein